jgi:SAM-dependent methyltransferase
MLSSLVFWANERLHRLRHRVRPHVERTWLYPLLTGPSRAVRRAMVRFRERTADGVFHGEDELWMCSLFPKKVIDEVLARFSPKSALDVGCGTGKSLEYFAQRGLDVIGIEGSALAISKSPLRERMRCLNLNEPIDLARRFDLVWSFEVAEHIHPRYAETLLETLTRHGDVIAISAATPGQGGEGHLNEQPPEYWIEKFAARGYAYAAEFSAKLRALDERHAENMLVFVRGGA